MESRDAVGSQSRTSSAGGPMQRKHWIEHWIEAYGKDSAATTHALNSGKEIPRIEIGHGTDPGEGDTAEALPKGWVR